LLTEVRRTTWIEYKHSNGLELMHPLLLDDYLLVSIIMLNSGCCCSKRIYTVFTVSILVKRIFKMINQSCEPQVVKVSIRRDLTNMWDIRT